MKQKQIGILFQKNNMTPMDIRHLSVNNVVSHHLPHEKIETEIAIKNMS